MKNKPKKKGEREKKTKKKQVTYIILCSDYQNVSHLEDKSCSLRSSIPKENAYHLEDKQQRSLEHQVCLQKIAAALDEKHNTRSTMIPLSVLIILLWNEKFVFLVKRL